MDNVDLLWSLIWFVFIAFLCFLFNSANPLWLLIIWFLGVYYR